MDRDLTSVQEARDLLVRAHRAGKQFAHASQEEVDRIVRAVGEACELKAAQLARSAVDETRIGRYEDKVTKNLFSSIDVRNYILPLKTCGIIREDPDRRVQERAVPMGTIAALVPTTNPTSTVIYKALIAIKARDSIVFSPHPRATRCIADTVQVVDEAARSAGAPEDLVLSMMTPTLDGTSELMRHELTDMILATGGSAMVRAAYSSGKPAYGVGPGNVPAIVERTAHVGKAVADIIAGKNFDYGLLCSAENSLICDAPIEADVRNELRRQRAVFVTGAERDRLQRAMQDPRTGGINSEIVGLPATEIAQRAGISVAGDTRVLVCECESVGQQEFFSREKLSPVLAFYVENGWEKCCERSIELLEFGGVGHSLVIHSNDENVIQRFFEEKPAFRIVVNTVCALGAVGSTTGLAPAMTLGPGAWGGSSTSDNITPLHLINIKRLARETKPFVAVDAPEGASAGIAPLAKANRSSPEKEIAQAVESFLAERRARRSS